MFFIVAILMGIVLGYTFGGRLSHLAALRFRRGWLIVLALAIQFSIFPLFGSRALLPYATVPLHFFSYALIFAFLAINHRTFPFLIIGSGAAMNVLVIGVNGGRIPSSVEALVRAGNHETAALLVEKGGFGNVILMSENTKLNALGDLFWLPEWFPYATAFSVGDLIIAIGLLCLVVWGMKSRGS
jgi:hypothetical protein